MPSVLHADAVIGDPLARKRPPVEPAIFERQFLRD
jgi:hypothetical protein